MSQSNATDYNIDPFTTSGQMLATILDRLHDSFISSHSGAARPPYAKAGVIWLDTSTPPGTLMWFDGTADHPLVGGPGEMPKLGKQNQFLIKASGTDFDADWGGVAPGSIFTQDMTGLNAVALDCSKYDVFDLPNMDTAAVLNVNNMAAGQTIFIGFQNGVIGVTIQGETVTWPGGNAPTYTSDWDTIVLTKLTTVTIGAYTLGHA